MKYSTLGPAYREQSRAVAPVPEASKPNWRYRDEFSVLVRHGVRTDDGTRFLRIDYDPRQAGLSGAEGGVQARFTVARLDPVSRAVTATLSEGTLALAPTPEGGVAAELVSENGSGDSGGVRQELADWLQHLYLNPAEGKVAPVRLDLRFVTASGGVSDPKRDEPPHQLVLNSMQQRDRSNVAVLDYPTGSGREISWFLYTNPRAKDLGMLKTITPPYSEFNSDVRLFWEYEITAGGWVPAHPHDTEELWYVLEGEATYVADGEERVIRAGDAVMLYPGSWHGVIADRGTSVRYLCLDIGMGKENAAH